MRLLNTILSMIFPVNCASCGKKDFDLCFDCLISAPAAERESAKWIYPLFDYRHPAIKKSVWLLKYKNRKNLAGVFAEALYGKIMEEFSELYTLRNFRDPLLIPVPLSQKRLRERGYNQVELICDGLIKLDKEKNFILKKKVLLKIKETEHQARIRDRRKRLKNLTDTFIVQNPEIIKNKNVILIDDVTTTGATLNEARKTLRNAGARKIIAFTVAH